MGNGRREGATRRGVIAAAAAWAAPGASFAAPPVRAASMFPCLDAILVAVADRGQIAGLSAGARDPRASTVVAIAKTLPSVKGGAEGVAALKPDLVLASAYAQPAFRAALVRLGVRVETFETAETIAQSLADVRRVAALIGRPAEGEALARAIENALAAAAPARPRRPIEALVFEPRGFVAGGDTVIDDALRRLGFANAAARYGVRQWGNITLEALLADPPELLLAAAPQPGAQTLSERITAHPALARIAPRMRRDALPNALIFCGGPSLLTTAPLLAAARERFWAQA